MRTDQAPFNDPRVRRALALTLDRSAIVKGLLYGRGSVGNDSPFGPRFPSTDTSVPQRVQDLAQARQLPAAAGHPNGFKAVYTSETILEMPALAQVIQAQRAVAGKIERLLLEQTPVVIPYFLASLTPTKPNVQGTNPTRSEKKQTCCSMRRHCVTGKV